MKNVDAILTSDWHIRDTPPEAWKGDYLKAQSEAVKFVSDLQEEHDCPVLIAGDIFDKWNPSHELVSWIHFSPNTKNITGINSGMDDPCSFGKKENRSLCNCEWKLPDD